MDSAPLIHIRSVTAEDAPLLASIAPIAFMESHGHGATPEANRDYVSRKLTEKAFADEISMPDTYFHLLYVNHHPAGYSKIIMDSGHPAIEEHHVTKLERLYLLKEYYGMDLGKKLFDFNVVISKRQHQEGMWLYVWKENHRAVVFYQKQGFKIIGSHDFEISAGHYNPNHVMFLKY